MQIFIAAVEFLATVLAWILIERYVSTTVAWIALGLCLSIIGYQYRNQIRGALHKPQKVVYPLPNHPGIKIEGDTPPPSSQMCLGLNDEEQQACFCPRQVHFDLKALPTPPDTNYATEMTITEPPKQFQRLRIFLRNTVSYVSLDEVIPKDEKSVTLLGTMQYDKASFVIQSTAPKILYRVVMHSSEQMNVRCVNYIN
jgi:hypothetical protein